MFSLRKTPTTFINNSFNQQSRLFSASSANMVQKVYFDCTWTGPQVNVDASGKPTNTDREVKRKTSLYSSQFTCSQLT
jgi:hypothetical protein